MKIKKQKQTIFTITLTDEEIDILLYDLETAQKDWNTNKITDEIIKKLKEVRNEN